ncbi:alkaline phosphatase D family protein [Lutibacter citreus]|uniref:alkaline phosphatase D family protein n=1 Tax=Lutibacter citreus TaxID=2138210 RepID=UPI000DBE3FB8|nr:alkaline phosphatase D family protein [Lutibacter citreus]
MKMTAQFYPIKNYDPFRATLQIKKNLKWENVQEAEINYPGYTAHFRIEGWDDSKETEYRVVYKKNQFYTGIIRQNPINKDELVMAAFSCWSIYERHGGQEPETDIVDNLKKLKPDVLFFAGDQVYDHSEHYKYWLKFGESFGEIISNTPTITIPDDHDVGHGNLWGDGGRKSETRDGNYGGYYMPVSYLKEIERAQTWHLPDPYDPTPIEQGIGVYYTNLTWGGVSFAIVEDRKFKSGPKRVLEGKRYKDTHNMDVLEATLLGKRQLDFLEDWTTNWKGAEMKAVLSQTIFTNLATHSPTIEKKQKYSVDSNGWPQAGRNKALNVIRKSFSCMIAGDQHLGSVVHHGIEDWNNAGYSFAVPAAANYWMRWWNPDKPGKNHIKGTPNYTGEYKDAFHNKITVHAVANPTHKDNNPKNDLLKGRAAGYGIIKFNKPKRAITFECWERNVDMFAEGSKPYNGWPITFSQLDNFKLKDAYELPTLKISEVNQVVTVRNDYTKEVISSLRINGNEYKPNVMYPGSYTIEVGEGKNLKRFFEVEAVKYNKKKLIIN